MAGKALTTASSMACPHGGTVTASSSNTRVKAAGAYVLRATDTFTIAGCSFSTAAGPMPCLSVQWVVPDAKSKVGGDFTLSEGSTGFCLNSASAPQGAVLVSATQPSVKTS